MDTQRQHHSGKKPLSGASKRPDAFWSLIVPSARLKKGRLDHNKGATPAPPQLSHAEELKGTQPAVRKEKGTPHVITRADATDLHTHLGVTPKVPKPMEGRAKGRPESGTREKPVDLDASTDEDRKGTQAQPGTRREKRRSESTARAQPALPYISLAEQLKRKQPVENDKQVDNGGLFERGFLAPTSALKREDKDEESSEGPDDIEGSDDDEGYPSRMTTRMTARLPLMLRVLLNRDPNPRMERLEEQVPESEERKKAPSQPASAKGERPRKRVKFRVEESDDDSDENFGEEEDEEEAANRSVPYKVNRRTKACAQRQKLSILPAVPPLSRQYQPWTEKEDETLFSLRNQGKSWTYIGERILGRTTKGAKSRWDILRTESLRPVESRAKGPSRRLQSSVVSVMAKTPMINKPWSKDEEEILIRLRTQGKRLKYICRQIRGKSYAACKNHWRKIKGQYQQTVTAPRNLESDGKGDPSDRRDTRFSSASQLDQEAKDAKSDSSSAIVECKHPRPSTDGDLPIDPDVSILSATQPYQEPIAVHVNLASTVASKSPKFKATLKDYYDQQASNAHAVGEDLSANINGSAPPDRPDPQDVIARRDPETKKEGSYQENLLLVSLSAQGTQKLGTHRRSRSWPQ
ncbi:hypothetical protein HO173_008015 [Letharia columbiana]|uniref:Myb-like domain-containing protein n=1 Tax=Letharia columbiana TaxID=112416 RepID=A0A8H6FSF9_9LECA|nr:uncharacterized protein HO173_008015 [Letharia columbiana]KAF6233803.1 hypothetical protein HO173_008015 [Letharia columbiana]